MMSICNGTYAGFVPPSTINKTTDDFKSSARQQPQTHTSTSNNSDKAKTATSKRVLLGSLTKR